MDFLKKEGIFHVLLRYSEDSFTGKGYNPIPYFKGEVGNRLVVMGIYNGAQDFLLCKIR